MKKTTAIAHSNIALVKYWGKGDDKLRLPVNSSAAITLDNLVTTTTVEFSQALDSDTVELVGDGFEAGEIEKVSKHLDLIRAIAKIKTKARVVSQNSFPKAAGMASSASGFAALTVAAAVAAGLKLTEKELSIIARQGSGSASRSVPGGLSVWHAGSSSETSYAEKIEYPKEWDLRVLLVMANDTSVKKVGSTEGMALATTSPYFTEAKLQAERNIERLRNAMSQGDFAAFGKVIEDECYRLHMLCMTSTPNILYWRGVTIEVFQALLGLRGSGVLAYFTVDAGPHVHIVCRAQDVDLVKKELEKLEGIKTIIECGIGEGARVVQNHLF